MELLKLFVLVLVSFALNNADAKPQGLTAFVNEYNKNAKSHSSYIQWIAKYETPENVEFLKKYLAQNPKIELRKLEIVDGDLVYNGKKKYSRVSIISLEKGEFKMYGKLVKVPLFKPYASILKKQKVASNWNWIALFLPEARAEEMIMWSGESVDMFTSLRVWHRANRSKNADAEGRYETFCYRTNDNAINEIFDKLELSDEDTEDNCHQVLLELGEIAKYYNFSMDTLNRAQPSSATYSKEIATPGCILNSITAWKNKYCQKLDQGKFKGCRIVVSKPEEVFTCGESLAPGTKNPAQIGLAIQWESEKTRAEKAKSQGSK